jgi:hypothetical protein
MLHCVEWWIVTEVSEEPRGLLDNAMDRTSRLLNVGMYLSVYTVFNIPECFWSFIENVKCRRRFNSLGKLVTGASWSWFLRVCTSCFVVIFWNSWRVLMRRGVNVTAPEITSTLNSLMSSPSAVEQARCGRVLITNFKFIVTKCVQCWWSTSMAVWYVNLALHLMALTTPLSWHVKFCMAIIIYMPRNSIFTPAVTNLGMVRSFDIMHFLLASPIS